MTFFLELFWARVQLKCTAFHQIPNESEDVAVVISIARFREYILNLERSYKEAKRIEYMVLERHVSDERYDKEMMKRIHAFGGVLETLKSTEIPLQWDSPIADTNNVVTEFMR